MTAITSSSISPSNLSSKMTLPASSRMNDIPSTSREQVDISLQVDGAKSRTIENGNGTIYRNGGACSAIDGAEDPSLPTRVSPTVSTLALNDQNPSISQPRSVLILNDVHSPPSAMHGLGTLAGEDQLKVALEGKDRIFLLVLAQEIESFIQRIHPEHGGLALHTGAESGAGVILGPSFPVIAQATSKYQRMLVYKTAEWFGLKAIPGHEMSMVIGVLGSLDHKSTALRLATLVPRPKSPPQNFRIMQRAINSEAGPSNSASHSGEDDSSVNRAKTIEEREQAYALARAKIYGSAVATDSTVLVNDRSRRSGMEESEPVPRRGVPQAWEPVYPSLYNPPQPDYHQTSFVPGPYDASQSYGYQPAQYPSYAQMPDMQPVGGYAGIPNNAQYPSGNGYQQQQYMRSMTPVGPTGYPTQPMQGDGYGQWPMNGQNQMGSMGGWGYSNMPTNQHVPMPGIPQGMQYSPNPYQPQLYNQHPGIMQPTPSRPSPYHHSSTSSSISSRSYHDGSRPHSRGSTTSTKSGASSVRLGAMFPASSGGLGRQQAMKGRDGIGMTTLGIGDDGRRSGRGQSPASTTSSRSSRRAPTLPPLGPNQHPVPQRPDWSANNVPYHPSALPHPTTSANPTDFPPLLRKETNAEPMQVERARVKSGGTVWNGAGAKALQTNGAQGYTIPSTPRSQNIAPPPSKTPIPSVRRPQSPINSSPSVSLESDPDFPRRQPTSVPTPYDPSANSGKPPPPTVTNLDQTNAASAEKIKALIHSSSSLIDASSDISTSIAMLSGGVTVDEAIEARLAAVSLSSGISIGPPAVRGSSSPGIPASYAKIVRKD